MKRTLGISLVLILVNIIVRLITIPEPIVYIRAGIFDLARMILNNFIRNQIPIFFFELMNFVQKKSRYIDIYKIL